MIEILDIILTLGAFTLFIAILGLYIQDRLKNRKDNTK
jgi:hypothetical protein